MPKLGGIARFCLVILLILLLLSSSACLVFGTGKSYGYVTAVEDGLLWSGMWFRAELESSQTDNYLVDKKDLQLKEKLNLFAETKTRSVITYKRHLITSVGKYYQVISIEKEVAK